MSLMPFGYWLMIGSKLNNQIPFAYLPIRPFAHSPIRLFVKVLAYGDVKAKGRALAVNAGKPHDAVVHFYHAFGDG